MMPSYTIRNLSIGKRVGGKTFSMDITSLLNVSSFRIMMLKSLRTFSKPSRLSPNGLSLIVS